MPNRRSFLLGAASLPLLSVAPKFAAASTGEEYDLFAIAGQSNAMGAADIAHSPAVIGGSIQCVVPKLVKGVPLVPPHLKALADPVQQSNVQDRYNYQTGSMWPFFANEWHRLTGRKVCICGGARNGQGLLNAWRLDEPYPNLLVEKVGHAKRLLGESGNTGILRGVIWCGGEQDAISGVTEDLWRSEFVRLLRRFRVLFNDPHLPMFCVSTDRMTDPALDANFAAIRRAQASACAEVAGLALVSPYLDFVGQGFMVDDRHWNHQANAIAGTNAAVGAAESLF